MIKRFFSQRTPQQVAQKELFECRHAILQAETECERAKATLALLLVREERLAGYAE